MRARKTPKKNPKGAIQRTREFRSRQRTVRAGTPGVPPIPTVDSQPDDNTRPRPSTSKKKPMKNHVPRPALPYTNFRFNECAHRYFKNKFYNNPFGSVCEICDRLWFQSELRTLTPQQQKIIAKKFNDEDISKLAACRGCIQSLARNNIPTFAKFNGFNYPPIPAHLPPLNSVSARLISPKLPFLQVRRVLTVEGHDKLLTQVINVPTTDDTVVHQLPRNMFHDCCINVQLDEKRIYDSVELMDFVKKSDIQVWLEYLITTPLYTLYNITIDEPFFDDKNFGKTPKTSVTEEIPIAKSSISQQQTLLWSVDRDLHEAPSDGNTPHNTFLDDHAEELSFPEIYCGQIRTFHDGFRATPFSIVSSELRRADRRGVTPQHLLYMAMKIMKMRVSDAISATSKIIGTDWATVKQQMLSEEYINQSLDSNLAFLRCIPNSTWYWVERKRDLLTMLRQLGKPTLYLTLSANETGWIPLLQILYKLKYGKQISENQASQMSLVERSTLVNEDAVTCAIYFSKMLNVLMTILQSKKGNPFQDFYVTHYFQHIDFQPNGSPQARILLWVSNGPKDSLGTDMATALELIEKVISVSARESSGFIDHQIHRHSFQCYDKGEIVEGCKFGAPFLPSRITTIITPLPKTDIQYTINLEHYKIIKKNLENNDYADFESFYDDNGITSDNHYLEIIRAGIDRPKVILKRQPFEKWHENFNPFILNILNANMNIELIPDDYSCADYVMDLINKADRGISDLRRRILAIMNMNPQFNISDIARELSAEVLNSVEITTQEAAWYLLREPTWKNSSTVIYIPTVRPGERPKFRKNHYQLVALDVEEESPQVWKESWFDKYENRPAELEGVTLAQFVANYTRNLNTSAYVKRKDRCLIRYRNYDRITEPSDYMREMVTLHVPFRNEELEIIADDNYLRLFKMHELSILARRQGFEYDVNTQGTLDKYTRLFQEETLHFVKVEGARLAPMEPESDPFAGVSEPELPDDWDSNSDSSTVTSESPIPIKRETEPEIAGANSILCNLLTKNGSPFNVFLSGPVACPKTFIIRIMTEVYNRYKMAGDICNVFTNYSSSNITTSAVDNPMIYTTLRSSLPNILALSVERAEQFRILLESIQILIIENVNTISAEIVAQIDMKLKQITGIYDVNFGGISIILVGELKKSLSPPVVPIPNLLNTLKYLELNKVMQQSNELFKIIVGKIAKGVGLEESEIRLIESRFFTEEEAHRLCPHGIRVFESHSSVNDYNHETLDSADNKIVSVANDVYVGCPDGEEEIYIHKFLEMSIVQTRGLPYEIVFVMQKLYMVTANYDLKVGLVAGVLVKLMNIERDVSGEVTKVWVKLMTRTNTGRKRKRVLTEPAKAPGDTMVCMIRQKWCVPLNEAKTITATRDHFPLLPACAVTMDLTAGKTFDELVYEHRGGHSQVLMHMALSAVTRITGLYITTRDHDPVFHHRRKTPPSVDPLAGATPSEDFDQPDDKSMMMDKVLLDFIIGRKTLSVLSYDHQTRSIGSADLNTIIRQTLSILFLLETQPDDEDNCKMPDFNCEVRFKCSKRKTNSISIHKDNYDRTNIVTGHMNASFRQSICLIANAGSVGEICGARCLLENDKTVLTVMLYVSQGQTVDQLIKFIHEALLAYTVQGAALLKRDLGEVPMIFGGHFNMNLAGPDAQPLINFLDEKFSLKINKDQAVAPTNTGATISALFCRHLEKLESTNYVLYSSFDKPIAP
ncbi:uncharacterized protein LOC135166507 [Diachasmimorpha longicaudata]|uniref:uncharacterized protein LOC135166507 n=1 Tax=Diachasmimorpha longicaudata TaxID=58733 RepID=UPI0030B8A304